MKEFTFKLDLYQLYDRAYEDCIANVTIEVPDTFEHHCPKIEDVRVSEITIDDDTTAYLEGTYHTDMDVLIKQIGADMSAEMVYDEFLESFGEDWDDAKYDEWAETCTTAPEQILKHVELTNIEAVTKQLLESVKP